MPFSWGMFTVDTSESAASPTATMPSTKPAFEVQLEDSIVAHEANDTHVAERHNGYYVQSPDALMEFLDKDLKCRHCNKIGALVCRQAGHVQFNRPRWKWELHSE